MKETMLITGASGFLGEHLCRKYKDTYNVVAISRNQKNLFQLKNKLSGEIHVHPCDVSNIFELEKVFYIHKPSIVIHAAATKFVDWAELFPDECVNNNIIGSKNVLDLCMRYESKILIGVSTDKASPPIKNIYGLTKATMEKLFTLSANDKLKVACVRYGNVLWSTGSVLPVWHDMYLDKKKILTTGPHMTRFFFTVDDAVNLIDFTLSSIDTVSGSIISKKMKVCKIESLLKAFCEVYGTEYEKEDVRPGERDYEILVSESEMDYTNELQDGYLRLQINARKPVEAHIESPYSTLNALEFSHEELVDMVKKNV